MNFGDLSLLSVGLGDVRMSIGDIGVVSSAFLERSFGEIVSRGVCFDSEEREEDDPAGDDLHKFTSQNENKETNTEEGENSSTYTDENRRDKPIVRRSIWKANLQAKISFLQVQNDRKGPTVSPALASICAEAEEIIFPCEAVSSARVEKKGRKKDAITFGTKGMKGPKESGLTS